LEHYRFINWGFQVDKIRLCSLLVFVVGDYQLSAPNIYFTNKSNRL
jgi:hypothetical protein